MLGTVYNGQLLFAAVFYLKIKGKSLAGAVLGHRAIYRFLSLVCA
jgi:hypothetical protein